MICEACGDLATSRPYGASHLCARCKRLAASWCWVKLAGRTAADIVPRREEHRHGQSYECELCGLWHWTLSEAAPAPETVVRIRKLARLFRRTGFRIHEHQARPRLARPAGGAA